MAVVMKQFIDKFKAMEKVANETLAANPEALVGVDSMPGSEHDQKVPADAKKPDEEVAQGQPAGATTTEGAVNGGDAKILNEGKLEMDQPLLNPEQKPLITDDALTAKTANAQLVGLVNDLLADLHSAEKKAQCSGGGADAPKAPAASKKDESEKKDEGDGKEKKASKEQPGNVIRLDDQTIAKLAAAQVAFASGRKAAEVVMKKAEANVSVDADSARKLIKEACVKAAQEQGLDPAAADAAAENAMAAAGMAPAAPAEVSADAAAAAADAAAADADAGATAADAAASEIPEDVTEEELATAIVDLVSSGELDPDTAKALVEEIAGDEGAAGPTEDQAAEIIAQGLENGEITPEQAQEIAAAVEGGALSDAGAADAAAADEEAQGAADAAAAIQDAQDEAKGAADAEEAIKSAAAHVRQNALQKVASKVVEKRAAANEPAPGSKVMAKVASILKTKVEEKKAAANPGNESEAKYIAGFRKKAEEMGVDPSALARYVVESQPKQAK